jgi:hypothetical protein
VAHGARAPAITARAERRPRRRRPLAKRVARGARCARASHYSAIGAAAQRAAARPSRRARCATPRPLVARISSPRAAAGGALFTLRGMSELAARRGGRGAGVEGCSGARPPRAGGGRAGAKVRRLIKTDPPSPQGDTSSSPAAARSSAATPRAGCRAQPGALHRAAKAPASLLLLGWPPFPPRGPACICPGRLPPTPANLSAVGASESPALHTPLHSPTSDAGLLAPADGRGLACLNSLASSASAGSDFKLSLPLSPSPRVPLVLPPTT